MHTPTAIDALRKQGLDPNRQQSGEVRRLAQERNRALVGRHPGRRREVLVRSAARIGPVSTQLADALVQCRGRR
jgi:hypothetical protein